MLSEAQKKALDLGRAIRNIACMDSIANRYFEPALRVQIRRICDEQMNLLGYESLTEHRKRFSKIFKRDDWGSIPNKEFRENFRYKKLEDL